MRQHTLLLAATMLAATMLAACAGRQKGAAADSDSTQVTDSTQAVALDTTPPPMFLMGADKGRMLMLYWAELEEPKKDEDNAEYFDDIYRPWALQDLFRRNRTQYTNLVIDTRTVKIKYVDEVLLDPDGERPSIGMLHSREEIPSLSARYTGIDGNRIDEAEVMVTDQYLASHKLLPIELASPFDGPEKPLPASAVKQLEAKYGMKATRSAIRYTIGDRYTWGKLQFKGEYKQAKRKQLFPGQKFCLALDVLIDGDKVYANEQEGFYESDTNYGWNVDDEGEYVGCNIRAAFEGPQGLELCYDSSAPESWEIGMFYLRDSQLECRSYTVYQTMVDEPIPLWKKEIAKMQKLYETADDDHGQDPLAKYCLVDIDEDGNPEIWMRDKDEEYGALFTRKGNNIRLVTTETPKMKFYTRKTRGGRGYICKGGPAGGPSYYNEVVTIEKSRPTDVYHQMQVYDNIEGELNGKTLSAARAKAYLDGLPESIKLEAPYWTETQK